MNLKKSLSVLLLSALAAECHWGDHDRYGDRGGYGSGGGDEYGSGVAFSFGPANLMGNDDMAYQFELSKFWKVDPQADVRLTGSFAVSQQGESKLGMLGIGLNAYLTDNQNIAPYVGGTFGFGSDLDSSSGFAAQILCGVAFFRNSRTQLFFEPNFQYVFTKSRPQLWGLQIGLRL